MENSITYPIAKNQNGEWTHIKNANRNDEYRCLECGNDMIPRMGEVNSHHFAHYPGYTGICGDGESAWHLNGKYILADAIRKEHFIRFYTKCFYIFNNAPYYGCDYNNCPPMLHEYKITDITIEKALETKKRPDFTIKLENGTEIYGEVIYSNPINSDKITYYVIHGNPVLTWVLDKNSPCIDSPLPERGIFNSNLLSANDLRSTIPGIRISVPKHFHSNAYCPAQRKKDDAEELTFRNEQKKTIMVPTTSSQIIGMSQWITNSTPGWQRILKESIEAGDTRREKYARYMLETVLTKEVIS